MSGGYAEGLQIDRIDNNGNYEPDNCRWVTRSINSLNTRKSKGSSSQYRGVFWHKRASKWMSAIHTEAGQKYLGLYEDEKEAAHVYDNYIYEHNLKHHTTNFGENSNETE